MSDIATALPRRTQRDRREATVARLVDATIDSLLAVGYARTSVKEVCLRAGVSHGGLFRHFDTMLDLIMAAAEEVARRQIENAERGLAQAVDGEDPLVTALYRIRDACRAPINAVFYELVVAARTDPLLHRALVGFSTRYADAIAAATARMPGVGKLPPDLLGVIVSSALHLFDGEALTRSVLQFPELEERRMGLLVNLVKSLVRSYAA
ncbi:TetR/AcrR family transcriptional regulator [Oleomonas cavernae]|uniref:TetR/AcrR family transcriptional regulator n=1 Tax=Oleomonas cavernae TaxID=2320859 RepID=UPI00131461F4|nr:TetR/AcrR family transcriptional regulator [Oleomonas cavernae]